MGTRSRGGGRRGCRDRRRDHASRPQGYVVYPGYAQPVYGPGCYWASEPVYDGLGRVVGYTGRPVQVCPGYVPPPPPAPGNCSCARRRPLLLAAPPKMNRNSRLFCVTRRGENLTRPHCAPFMWLLAEAEQNGAFSHRNSDSARRIIAGARGQI